MAEGIDLREYRAMVRDMKEFKPDKQVKKALKQAGALIADDARVLVSPFSQTVPGSIRVRTRKTSISVLAGGEGVPMAGLLEMGNRRQGKGRLKFRHRVFGKDVWVDQDMHPYLLRATRKNMHSIEHFEGEIVADAFKEIGWH